MIICHIITAFGYGGAEKLLVDLVNIQSTDNEVHIVYLKGQPLLGPMLKDQALLHKIDLNIRCAGRIRKFITALQPDVVHTHLGHADLIGLWACRGLNVKRFCTMHNIWFKWNWRDHIIFFIYSVFFSTIAKNCKVISISKSVSNHVKNTLGVSQHNNILLNNAIPDSIVQQGKNELRDELAIQRDAFCVLFVGRLEIQKSVDTLLFATKEIMGRIQNLRVLIVGNGSLMEKLQNLKSDLGISNNVIFVGHTSEAEKYFKASDVFVLPSVFEGFGIVILEAFRASIPVVATAIEGPKELIEDNVNGLLFEPRDYKALADRIVKFYESRELREKIGNGGYLSYKDKFNIKSYAEQMEKLYLE